jgi:hypothetical protein
MIKIKFLLLVLFTSVLTFNVNGQNFTFSPMEGPFGGELNFTRNLNNVVVSGLSSGMVVKSTDNCKTFNKLFSTGYIYDGTTIIIPNNVVLFNNFYYFSTNNGVYKCDLNGANLQKTNNGISTSGLSLSDIVVFNNTLLISNSYGIYALKNSTWTSSMVGLKSNGYESFTIWKNNLYVICAAIDGTEGIYKSTNGIDYTKLKFATFSYTYSGNNKLCATDKNLFITTNFQLYKTSDELNYTKILNQGTTLPKYEKVYNIVAANNIIFIQLQSITASSNKKQCVLTSKDECVTFVSDLKIGVGGWASTGPGLSTFPRQLMNSDDNPAYIINGFVLNNVVMLSTQLGLFSYDKTSNKYLYCGLGCQSFINSFRLNSSLFVVTSRAVYKANNSSNLSFTRIYSPLDNRLISGSNIINSAMYLSTLGSGLLKSTDGSNFSKVVITGSFSDSIFSLSVANNRIFIVQRKNYFSNNSLFIFDPLKNIWERADTEVPFHGLDEITYVNNKYYFGFSHSGIYLSTDYKSWLDVGRGANKELISVFFKGSNFYTSWTDGVYLSSNYCSNWINKTFHINKIQKVFNYGWYANDSLVLFDEQRYNFHTNIISSYYYYNYKIENNAHGIPSMGRMYQDGINYYLGGNCAFKTLNWGTSPSSYNDIIIWKMNPTNFSSINNTIPDKKNTYISNPIENILTVSNLSRLVDFSIFNLEGREILKGSTDEKIDVSGLKQGVYLLKINSQTFRFVKL